MVRRTRLSRLPLVPTLLVGLAVAVMIGLGVWQLQRRAEKQGLLGRYASAQSLPPIAWPAVPDPENPPLFRRASAFCLSVAGWGSVSGRDVNRTAGWVHIASCRTGAEGPGFQAVMGWSTEPRNPDWRGGPVQGVIGPDKDHVIRLVASDPAPGLRPARPPSPEDVPNNHLYYAIQWFIFAGAAAVIYWLALSRRSR